MKKMAALILCVVVTISLLPTAYAAEGDTGTTADGFAWREMAGGTIAITGYTGTGGNISVPSSINSLPVTQLDVNCFDHNITITGVSIPSSVIAIGDNAFGYCSSLSSVTLCEGLHTIGAGAFRSTALTDVTIPSTVTVIDNFTFHRCSSLSSITLSEGLQTINQQAFVDTALTDVTIPSTVTYIGWRVFWDCANLNRAIVLSTTAVFDTEVFLLSPLTSGIYGFPGSTAQAYATANGIPFGLLHTVSFETNSGTPLNDILVCAGDVITAPTDPVRSGFVFSGWYLDSALTQPASFPMGISSDTTLHAKWTALTLSSSVKDGRIYTGGRITLTPSIGGGTWAFDSSLFSRDDDTFTALQVGTSTITYTVGGISVEYKVIIQPTTLPQTGQNHTMLWVFALLAMLTLVAALLARIKTRA